MFKFIFLPPMSSFLLKTFFGVWVLVSFCLPNTLLAQQGNESSSDEQLAAQFLAEGDYERAAAIYEELFEDNDVSPVIYNNYLRSLLELNDFRKAQRVVNTQIDRNPGKTRFEVDLGYVFTLAEDNRKARRHLEGLIKDVPVNPRAINDLANAFLFRDFVEYALQTYQKGRNLIGAEFPFNRQLAEIYERMGDYDKMMEEYIELVVMDESYMETIQGILQDALNNDPEFVYSDALRRVLLVGSQRNPAQPLYAEMLLWLSLQQNDFEMALRQAKVLDRRFGQEGKLVMEVAQLSLSNKKLEIARQGYEYILQMGDLNPFYLDALVGNLDVKYLQATTGYEINYDLLRDVELEYESTIDQLGITTQTVSLIRNLAGLKAFYLDKTDEAVALLSQVIEMPNVTSRLKAQCRIELGDILLLRGELWDAHLLYAQVDKVFRDDPIAHEARYKNARLSFYMGEFQWAKAQLDVLKAATSRLIANDAMALSMLIQDNLEEDGTSIPLSMYARAQMHVFMNHFDKAVAVLDSVEAEFGSHEIMDDLLMAKADIFKRTGEFEKADTLFAEVTQLYPDGLHAVNALFERALLQERVFQNKDKAMELYQQLMTDFPGSLHTVTARNRFRLLRGDTSVEEQFFYQQTFRP
jgi:tetratricopeptide (TPR) repeat protein